MGDEKYCYTHGSYFPCKDCSRQIETGSSKPIKMKVSQANSSPQSYVHILEFMRETTNLIDKYRERIYLLELIGLIDTLKGKLIDEHNRED